MLCPSPSLILQRRTAVVGSRVGLEVISCAEKSRHRAVNTRQEPPTHTSETMTLGEGEEQEAFLF
jgi:hypothetical protein